MVGSKIGHYEIRRRLGGGGMGEVYAAQDTRLNREVAIKLLPEELAQRDDRRERFAREATTVASLSHPNIVTVHAVEEADGRSFIVMELVRGRTLSEVIPSGGLQLDEFFRIALPLADAIHAAHMRGVSHRDLKPNNVMVSDDGHVKVLDFGLAKVMEPDTDPDGITRASSGLTAEGRILGTVAYMSPEQAEGKTLDHRSDVFSLGILLYEMLTGRRPFLGDNNIATLSSILKDTPHPLAELRQGLPLALGRILDRALEKSPDRRYQSAADLRRDLEDLQRDLNTGELLAAVSAPSAPSLESAAAPAGNGRRWLGAAAAASVVALLAWALWPAAAPELPVEVRDGARVGGGTGGVGVASATAPDARPSIAVFYFSNLEGDEELDWLRTGLTDMLVTQLSQSPRIRVLGTDRLYQLLQDHGVLEATTIPFSTVQAIADEADFNRSVVGSFLRENDRLRISARVQDVVDGRVIWSETVEGGEDASILDLADTLAARIRETLAEGADLSTTVADAEPGPDAPPAPRALAAVTSTDVDAWKEYTAGLQMEKQMGAAAAIPYLEAAIDSDPMFAMAFAKLSEMHDSLGNQEASAEYAARAVELEDRLPAPTRLFLRGRMEMFDSDKRQEGIETLQRTVEMYPDSVAPRTEIAEALIATDRTVEAIERLQDLREHNPTDLKTARLLAGAYAENGEIDRGAAVLQDYVQLRPTDPAGHSQLSEFLLRWQPERAGEVISASVRRGILGSDLAGLQWTSLVLDEDWDGARALAQEMAAVPDPGARWHGHVRLALLALYAGDPDAAVAALRSGFESLPPDDRMRPQAAVHAAAILLEMPAADRALQLAEAPIAGEVPAHLRLDLERIAAVAATIRGDAERATRHLQRFRELRQRVPMPEALKERAWRVLQGQLALAEGDFATAAGQLQSALGTRFDGRGRDLGLAYQLGLALTRSGEADAGARWFRRIADGGPSRAEEPLAWIRSLYRLGAYHAARGETEAAAGYYRRFLTHRERGTLDRDLVQQARAALDAMPD